MTTGGRRVAIVGAGPVGLAAAIALRQRDFSVDVYERRSAPPIDKACGEGLMPDAVANLERLGVSLVAGRPFRGIRYLDECSSVDGSFPSRSGRAVRRLELYRVLLDRALECGARVHFGTPVELERTAAGRFALRRSRTRGLEANDLEVKDGARDRLFADTIAADTIVADTIVAADGLRSRLRTASGLAREVRSAPEVERYGLRCHFAMAPWSDLVEVYWGEGCEAYVTPTGQGEVGVAFLFRGRLERARPDGAVQSSNRQSSNRQSARRHDPVAYLLRGFPALERRLRGAERTTRVMGAGPLYQRVRRVSMHNLFLLGDAAGYVDAITGEGLALGFHQALLLGKALAEGGDYESLVRRHRRTPELLTRLTLVLSSRPWLRRRVLAALERRPSRFDRLLAIHCRESSWPSGVPVLLRLALGARPSGR